MKLVAALLLACLGCATRQAPPAATGPSPLQVVGDEMALRAEAGCIEGCESQVRGECVLAAITQPDPNPDCVTDKSLACRMNCSQ